MSNVIQLLWRVNVVTFRITQWCHVKTRPLYGSNDTRSRFGDSALCATRPRNVILRHWFSTIRVRVLSAGQLIEFSTIAICIAPVEDACDGRRREVIGLAVVIQVDLSRAHTRTHIHIYTNSLTSESAMVKGKRDIARTVSIAYSLINLKWCRFQSNVCWLILKQYDFLIHWDSHLVFFSS